MSQWERPDEVAAAGHEPRGPLWDPTIAQDFPDFVPRMQFLDMVSYLPDDILTKVDRATMAVGLEGRVPLLDHRVVAYSWSLPLEFKVRGGTSKWLLRRVLDRYVPRPLIDRPKMGFGVPIDAWLRGPLREWAESLLAPGASCVRRLRARRAGAPGLAGAPRGQPQLAISAVDRADAAGLAREVGVTSRPRKILYVTADLRRRRRRGHADAAGDRAAAARRRNHVVSLLPAEADMSSDCARQGVTVVELDFDTPGGIAAGLFKLARLIADNRPDIVQGWMYHGDLAALVALVMSGRRRQTRLVWSIRCSDMDLRRYGVGLRLVVKACTAAVAMARSGDGQLGCRPQSRICASAIARGARRSSPTASTSTSSSPTRPRAQAVRGELGIPEDAIVARARRARRSDEGSWQLPRGDGGAAGFVRVAGGRRHGKSRRSAATSCAWAAATTWRDCSLPRISSSRARAFGEGFSNALAEGMACGLPAIATDVGDAKLIVGDTGLVVPPENPHALAAAIRALAGEPAAARAERRRKARARIVEQFAMAHAIQRYGELYASLGAPRD